MFSKQLARVHPLRVRRKIGLQLAPVRARFWERMLDRRNRVQVGSVLGSAPVVVSLTTYGHRLFTVHRTIESIARGAVKPRRLILWLDDALEDKVLPDALNRLRSRGLEIRFTRDDGPHKKYYPYVTQARTDSRYPLVTADDDVVYPRTWLRELLAVARLSPKSVVGWRVRVVGMTPDGTIAPYRTWEMAMNQLPSLRHFATGTSGTLYPPSMQDHIAAAGSGFRESAPFADDVWLHQLEITHGVEVRQVRKLSYHFVQHSATSRTTLTASNVGLNRNDVYIQSLYDQYKCQLLENDLLYGERGPLQ